MSKSLFKHFLNGSNAWKYSEIFSSILPFLLMLIFIPMIDSEIKETKGGAECYLPPKDWPFQNIDLLEDISVSKIQPESRKSIFFYETSCYNRRNGIIELNARQACAIESAAYWNSNSRVFVLFAAPTGFPKNASTSPIIKALQRYPNIYFRNANISVFSAGTPGGKFFRSGRIFDSKYLVPHMSDFLRYVGLYKYGGIYFDTDVIVLRSFERLPDSFFYTKEGKHMAIIDQFPESFAGDQNGESVATGVMGYRGPIGSHIVASFIQEFVKDYQPHRWDHNGPALLTRILSEFCHTKIVSEMSREKCDGFVVFPPKEFYAISYREWDWFFFPQHTKNVLEITKKSSVIHVWNALSWDTIINKSHPETAYGALAKLHCPYSFSSSGDIF